MIKSSSDFVSDPLLQLMACNVHPFSKSDMIDGASTLLGIRMKSTRNFLARYEGSVIEGVDDDVLSNVPKYYLRPDAWIAVMKSMTESQFKRLACKAPESPTPRFWIRKASMDEKAHKDFVESYYAFLHGKPFAQQANNVGQPKEVADDLRPKQILRLLGTFPYQFINRLADFPENSDYFKEINEQIKDLVYEYRKLLILKEEPVNEKLLLNTFINSKDSSTEKVDERLGFLYLYLHFLRDGNLQKALDKVSSSCEAYIVLQMISLIQNKEYAKAIALFQRTIRGSGNHFMTDNPLGNFYYAVALYLDKSASTQKKVNTILRANSQDGDMHIVERTILSTKLSDAPLGSYDIYSSFSSPLEQTLYYFVLKHFHRIEDENILQRIDNYIADRAKKGLKLLNLEMSADFDCLKSEQATLEKETGMHPSLPYIKVLAPWEKVLNEILDNENVSNQDNGKPQPASTERISYLLSLGGYYVQPRLQKSRDGINWSAGRNIALKTFRDSYELPYTDQDRRVAMHVEEYSRGWYGNTSYELCGPAVVEALVGHPLVFDADNPSTRIDIVRDRLQLSVVRGKGGYTVKSNIGSADDVQSGFAVYQESPQCVKVVKVSDKQQQSLALLNRIGTFPLEAKDKLAKVLEAFSRDMVVMSDLLKNTQLKTVDPDSRIYFRLQPIDDQIMLQLFVKPFAVCPPYLTPAEGMDIISTTFKGESLQTHRDMNAERKSLAKASELLQPFGDTSEDGKWLLSIEQSLDLLDLLRQHPDAGTAEWPEGAHFSVRRNHLTPSAMHLSVNSLASWFDISGDIEIGEGEKLKIAELMDKVRQSKGHFIALGDNEYVAVSEQLRKQLAILDKMGQQQHGQLRIAVYHASELEDMDNEGVDLKADQRCRDFIKRVEESGDLKVRVPRNINAELRDYQKEGYVWMSRLAYWGAGALLADDMGLGKTLQAITVLLSRAKEGAALVVVPTSLILNWRDELARFAPGLNVKILNQAGEDRGDMLRGAAAFDVVITTYGLLINEEENLCAREWNTIVLDEAHTIKNRDTKMSKAAMKLKGNFRMLLTGTPVQNNLSEIWNLMQFANPSLLGSFQQFTDRFITPIEKLHDKSSQRLLRRVISPFILRRTKNDVLNELPEKTEVTRKVQLSEAEWALYDNIRQRALVNLADGDATPLQTLTELTRLRQAACNAQLIDKSLNIPSSKEAVFLEMVDSLHDNHHRALVFSQFTSHLALIRKALDERGVEYLYLDGATPAKERDRLVKEFQTGDMPLFLISLKAGGLGLNLTAADYVIHLDPWWNPAIEEQASDRAYRIGQHNPVTVYRLIAEGTIEEKIIQLHQSKKSLADALLEGGDLSAKLSKDELLQLLRER